MTTDPWTPDPIPATLPHKPFTLPAIGTDSRLGRDSGDDLDSFVAQFEREHGPASVLLQKHRIDDWAKTVAAYEADPNRFALAWHYLDSHPIFYRFRYAPDGETDLAQIVQERNLEHDCGLYELYFKVATCCVERCENDGCRHPARDICWVETGPWSWPAMDDPEHPSFRPPGSYSSHDYRLDVCGESYESCIVQLAHKVWTLYGNDRALEDTVNQFEEEVVS